MQGFAAVDAKLAEARRKLMRLAVIDRVPEYYDALNDFLAAARSIEFVLSFQFGIRDLKHSTEGRAIELALSHTAATERRSFDHWLAKEGKAVREHVLKAERDQSIHRSGQVSAHYYPHPYSGLAIEAGTSFSPALVTRGGRIGLPLENTMRFFYTLPDGTESEALPLCEHFMAALETLVAVARGQPWK
jgi:hypothetical protein